jgi:hypothetical protein
MAKMQSVSFASVSEFLDFLPEDELMMVEILRKLIFSSVPDITEKLSYNVPFYKKNKGMFFIWPASVLWGKNPSHHGVRFGFQQGNLLTDEIQFLDGGKRKQVYWKDFHSIKEINIDLLKAYIFEAAFIDDGFKRKG